MPLVNESHISGGVATDPMPSGKGPTRFRLAHGRNGELFSIAVWDWKVVQGLTKGMPIEIFGTLTDSSYVTKDGTARSAAEIVADPVIQQAEEKSAEKNLQGIRVTDDDIPF